METVSLKLEKNLLINMEKAMKKYHYATKTEFVREALRDKILSLEQKEALLWINRIYGAGAKKGRKITDEDIHRAREEAARELAQKYGVSLD